MMSLNFIRSGCLCCSLAICRVTADASDLRSDLQLEWGLLRGWEGESRRGEREGTSIIIWCLFIARGMSQAHKKQKRDSPGGKEGVEFGRVREALLRASRSSEEHPFRPLLERFKDEKHPILQTVNSQHEVYKTNPEKKKKPLELYLDTVSHLYKKRDLDILINPVTPTAVFEKWSPREVAIFEEGILRFGKQFEFISELVGSKNPKDVYEFYLEWRSTSHFKSFRSYMTANNRTNLEDLV